ncbi:glycosyltransferase, group 1 family protein [Clostridiales bacterium 1_7_47FAA]|uniref:Glycosyltransferase family 1 protein n=1 Tax=Enterocloster hominis (ex Hitch et al. 2024) TaxID=1917870 RepID=A0ABV1DB30_9FIRM|nr:glycosyltransferase, group 1 family protein [Clostridiales bacterium 1_7_47FAA]
MRVAISGYVGKKITGIGRNLISLLDNATGGTEFVLYVNEDMKGEFEFKNPNVKVKTYSVSKNSSMGNLLWTTFVFPFMVLKAKANRALIPNFTLLLFKFKPTYVIMHDLIEYNVPNKFSKLKMFYRTKLANPVTARLADRIITVSNNSKRDLMKFLGVSENKITVIYNGVDQQKFKQAPDDLCSRVFKERGWPTRYLLYAGTIDYPGKNALSVIKVFERLKESGSYDGQLILAGMPGAGFEVVQEYVNQSKHKDDIIFGGFVTDEELVVLYSCCDVFCFVSFYEGFGIPPLEALACGAKVVVSNTSALPEVVGGIGWSVAPNSEDEIETAVKEALTTDIDDDYRASVASHLKKYEWDKLGKRFETVLIK